MQDDCLDCPTSGYAPDASPPGPRATPIAQAVDPRGVGQSLAAPAHPFASSPPPVANVTPDSSRTHNTRPGALHGAHSDDGAHNIRAHEQPDAQAQQALLRTVYEENLTAVYRFIYGKVGNREEAEDLTSQVFMKALRGMDRARDPQSIQNWLFQVARTTVADHWRAFYRLPSRSLDDLLEAGWEGPSDRAAPGEDVFDDEAALDVVGAGDVDTQLAALMAVASGPGSAPAGSPEARAQRILAQLPARYREVLTYRFLLNYSLKETAAQMQLTEANVKVLQFRALKKASQMEFPAS